jgi:hypothetical protein
LTSTVRGLPPLSPARLRERVLALCSLGNRFVGSTGERLAREYILEELTKAGLDPQLESLTVMGYRPERASCSVVGAQLALPAVGLQYTASAVAEAEAVYLGAPASVDDLDQAGADVNGRIAVISTQLPFVFADVLAQRGAVGLVVIDRTEDGLIGHFTARAYPALAKAGGGPLAIPGVTVEATAGHRLLALMSDGPRRLRLEHAADYAPVETANVVAELIGSDARERVVVGGHYDTQLDGVGACDNATGIATLLELARTWGRLELRRTVVLVAFADEEHGSRGATEFCRHHSETIGDTVGMVNLDALAWVYPARRMLHADPSIRDFAATRAAAAGWESDIDVEASSMAGADDSPFIDAGVPACWLWRYPPNHSFYHSRGDTPELLDFELVADTARAAAHVAFCLAHEPELELGRSRPKTRWLDLRPGIAASP